MKVEEARAEYAVLTSPATNGPQWKTMGDIADVVGGGTPRTSDPSNFEGGDIPWLTPADLSGYTEKYVSHGARFITRKGLESSSARILPAGSVLFTSRAPIGYVAIARNPLATNQGFKSFILKEGILSEYVYWWLKGAKQAAEGLASGTTFLELSGANAKKLPIPIVPLDQQKRIVEEIEKQFSRLDEAVANLKRVKANLKRYKAAVLKAAVEGRLVETEAELARREGRSYETGAQLLQRILESRRSQWSGKGKYKEPAAPDTTDLLELPEGWVWASLEMISGAIGGYAFSSKTFTSTGDQVVKMANVRMGHIDLTQRPSFVSKVDDEIRQKYGLVDGDVLVTLTGTRRERDYGYVAVVRNPKRLLLNQRIARLRAATGMEPDFLALALQSETYRNRFFGRETGNVGQGNVGMAAVTTEAVPVAPLAEQQRVVAEIERRLSLLRVTEAHVNVNLQRAVRLRQVILAKAFCGGFNVNNVDVSIIARQSNGGRVR